MKGSWTGNARRLLIAGVLAATLGGCATTTGPMSKVDPFEPWNRAMYDVNEVVDGKIFKPFVQAYVDYTPKPIQQVIRNFFGNIDDVFSAINGLLSGKLDSAGHDMGRVIVNTLAGFGGLIDVASEAGIPKGNLDFGLTFGTWGFPQGPYLFVPMIGPSFAVSSYSPPVMRAEAAGPLLGATGVNKMRPAASGCPPAVTRP